MMHTHHQLICCPLPPYRKYSQSFLYSQLITEEDDQMMVMAATAEPTILSRLHRLDIMMGYLEDIRGSRITRSSAASTTSSGTVTTSDCDDGNYSLSSSPKSLEKLCRPMDDVIVETQLKGTIVHRLHLLEDRVLKLSLHLEEEIEAEKKGGVGEKSPRSKKKNLKSLVKSCVGANHHHQAQD